MLLERKVGVLMRWWEMASPCSETVALLCQEQIPPLAAHLLAVRGITSAEEARSFLAGEDSLLDPFCFGIWIKQWSVLEEQ